MAWIGDTAYEAAGGYVFRWRPSGELDALGVRGRPGFAARDALSGVLYRVEWLALELAADAPGAGAAIFGASDPLRSAGNCVHLTTGGSGARQWWCYRPRPHDGGTLSLLHEWEPASGSAPRRGLLSR